jgi:hypothetical protein
MKNKITPIWYTNTSLDYPTIKIKINYIIK